MTQDAGQSAEGAPGGGNQQAARGGGRGNRATTVVLAPLEEQAYTLTLRTIGTATSLRNVDVVASEAGTIVDVALAANATVAQGDPLVELDSRTQQLDLDIAIAERDQAQATVDRYETLGATGNLTITDVTLTEAEVALRLADANVGLAQAALEDRVIRSPIDGELGLSNLHVGDYISANEPIVSIDNSSAVLAEFEVPERSIGLLSVGKSVLVGTPTYAGRVFNGTITGFDTQLDSVTRSATVRAEIDNEDGLLLSGMTFNVRMLEETDPLPVVPSTAITWDRNGAGIWISEEGKAARYPVAIRYREGDRVWVDTDVAIGTEIVTEGAAKLRVGSTISDPSASGERS